MTLVNSVNPYRLEGQKTAAFEVCEDLGGAPDYLAIPVGNAGNISAYWQGFTEYRMAGFVETAPVMLGFQAAGAAPLVLGRQVDRSRDRRNRHPHRRPGERGEGAARPGRVRWAHRHRRPTRRSSPRSATSPAWRACSASRRPRHPWRGCASSPPLGRIDPGATIVCVLTGHGLKDPDTAQRMIEPPLAAAPTVTDVRRVLGW